MPAAGQRYPGHERAWAEALDHAGEQAGFTPVERQSMDSARRVELLRSTLFFRNAEEQLLDNLARACDEVFLDAGEVLFECGDPGDALYVVDDGVLEIFIGETLLDESRRGECLGEMALVTDETRSASIRAREPSRLLRLSRAVFVETLERNPGIAWGIIQELAAKVKSSIRVRVDQHQFALRLEEAFARSVSHSVLEQILGTRNAGELLQGKTQVVTSLFANVRAFKSLSERVEPEELIQTLNEYLTGMVEVILDNGGTLDRFMGDGILAHFGVPLTGEKDALRAVRCATQMRERVKELNEFGTWLPQHPLKVGVGLATGTVVAGYIGSGSRMDYTAIGDVVNVASGVEGLTKIYRCGILMCDMTARAIGSDLLLREVDRVLIRGRGRPTHAFDFLGRPEDATPEAIRLMSDYRSAFALYAAGRFQEAAVQFSRLAEMFPDDGPSHALADRCRRYEVSPPPDWDCVFRPEGLFHL